MLLKYIMRGRIFYHFILILFLFLSLNVQADGEEEDLFSKIGMIPIKGDKKAPDFSLQDLNGKKIGLNQFKGKVIFINFWATWCGPCKGEMPSMETLHQQFKEKKFVLLAVSVDYEGPKLVKEFINKYQYTFPVLFDPDCKTLDLFEVKGIPTTFLIDKKGKMVGKAIGPRDWKSPEVTSLINLLVQK
jgi:peroxiredoxin